MRRVVATGTFDILHPGHLYYLGESRRLGDELFVIVARDRNVKHKPKPVIPEGQRLKMVAALRVVDHAVLGDLYDMFRPIEEIRPDIITFGYDQHFDEKKIGQALKERGLSPLLVRIGQYRGDPICSSREIVQSVRERVENSPGATPD